MNEQKWKIGIVNEQNFTEDEFCKNLTVQKVINFATFLSKVDLLVFYQTSS